MLRLYYRFRWAIKTLLVTILAWITLTALSGIIGNSAYELIKTAIVNIQNTLNSYRPYVAILSIICTILIPILTTIAVGSNKWRDALINTSFQVALRNIIQHEGNERIDAIERALEIIELNTYAAFDDGTIRFMVFEPDNNNKGYLRISFSASVGSRSISKGKFLIDSSINDKDAKPGLAGDTYLNNKINRAHLTKLPNGHYFTDNPNYWENDRPRYKSIITTPIRDASGSVRAVLCLDSEDKYIFDAPDTDDILKQVCSIIAILMCFPEYPCHNCNHAQNSTQNNNRKEEK